VILSSPRLAIAVDALARTYHHVVVDAGAADATALERLAQLAPQGVLVTASVPADAADAAQERMLTAGFATVTVFTGAPPQPATDARIAA